MLLTACRSCAGFGVEVALDCRIEKGAKGSYQGIEIEQLQLADQIQPRSLRRTPDPVAAECRMGFTVRGGYVDVGLVKPAGMYRLARFEFCFDKPNNEPLCSFTPLTTPALLYAHCSFSNLLVDQVSLTRSGTTCISRFEHCSKSTNRA